MIEGHPGYNIAEKEENLRLNNEARERKAVAKALKKNENLTLMAQKKRLRIRKRRKNGKQDTGRRVVQKGQSQMKTMKMLKTSLQAKPPSLLKNSELIPA